MQRKVETGDVEGEKRDQKGGRTAEIERRARTAQQRRNRKSFSSLLSNDFMKNLFFLSFIYQFKAKLLFPTAKFP